MPTRIYNQGDLQSCTANAVGSVVQYSRRKFGQMPDFTPSRLFIYYNGRVLEDSVPLDTGLQIRNAVKSLHLKGVCPEPDWPYDSPPGDAVTGVFPNGSRARRKPSEALYKSAIDHRDLWDYEVSRDLVHFKALIANKFPFLFGFTIYNSYFDAATRKPLTVFKKPDKSESPTSYGHCVVAVGYNDDTRLFLCRNSWGDQEQEGGYFYMPYESMADERLTEDFYVIGTIAKVM